MSLAAARIILHDGVEQYVDTCFDVTGWCYDGVVLDTLGCRYVVFGSRFCYDN